MTGRTAPRVLISYAEDDEEHLGAVVKFARLLRARAGIDVVLDLWHRTEHRDWSEWFAAQLRAASYVVLVGSPEYRRLSDRPVASDTITALQVSMLKQRLYGDRDRWLPKVLPVLLPGAVPGDLPDFVSPATVRHYRVRRIDLAGVEELCRVLTGQPEHLEPPLAGGPPGGPPRVVAQDRVSLEPMTLSPVARSTLLDAVLARRTKRVGAGREALVLTGEGGVGKSVLLGQLLDRLENDPEGSAVLLVSAASVPPGLAADEPSAVDRALGVAAHDEWGSAGLLALLGRLRDEHGAVTLLLDTLDLLLDQRSAVPLASVLARALDIGEVVLTCRTVEFGKYLSDPRTTAPRLAGRLVDFAVPTLTRSEILRWAADHVGGLGTPPAERAAFLESLAGGLRSSGSLRQVCALPVRLALTCQVFGRERHVPEDLTVTGLYSAYWDLRVNRHAGGAGEVKERAALDVATRVVGPSGKIALRVPKGQLPHVDGAGLRMLASEGVLHDTGTSWAFFHQTFAEYGHARWLLTQGVESAEVVDFTARVVAGQGTLWPIATSLLLQADDDQYRDLARSLPADTLDGAKTHTLGALQRLTPEPLNALLTDLADRADLLRVAVPALGEAPARHLGHAVEAVGQALRLHPRDLVDVAIAALVSLLARAGSAELLDTALSALVAVRDSLEADAWDHYAERLVEVHLDVPSADVRAVALDRYRSLDQLGRRAVLRLHLARAERLSDAEVVRLAGRALAGDCPPLKDDEAVAVFRLLWSSPGVRAVRDWRRWADVLAVPLPKGWNNGQVKFITAQAVADPAVAAEVVDDLVLDRSQAPEAHVNVFHQLARQCPGQTAARLLEHPVPTNRPALNAIAKCAGVFATELDQDTRARLGLWLSPARAVEPRAMWRAAVSLAADDVEVHRVLLAEVTTAELAPAVWENVVLSWYVNTPRAVVDLLLPELRALTDDASGDLVEVRARLEGRVVDTDEAARTWVRACLFEGPSPVVAGTAIKTLADTVDVVSPSLARWLTPLPATRHVDAAERLATFLSRHRDALAGIADQLLPVALDRMETAARASGSSNLSRALVTLVIGIDRQRALAPADVRRVHEIICSRLPLGDPRDRRNLGGKRDNDFSAAFRDLTRFTGVVTGNRLGTAETRALAEAVLRTLDPRVLGGKIDRSVVDLLRGFADRDPVAVDWLEDLFGEPDLAVAVKSAIAEVFLALDGTSAAGGRAARLKDRPDCPPEVAAVLVTKLRS